MTGGPAAGTLLLKWQMLQAIVCDPSLSAAAKAVAARLLHHHNTLTGQCSPSYDTLAQAIGAARSTVIKAVSDLQAGGWVSVERVKVPGRTGAQAHVSNRYSFALDRITEDHGGSPKSEPPPSPDFIPPPSLKSAPPPSEICTRGSPKSGPEHGKLEQGKRKKTLTVVEPSAFDRWWAAYHRKVGKEAARPVYERILKSGRATEAELLAGAERYAAERTAAERSGEDRKYTKHPTTWLRGGHWTDEPAAPPRARPQPRAEKTGITDLLRDLEGREPHGRDHDDSRGPAGAIGRAESRFGADEGRHGMGGAGPILDLEPIRPNRK